MNKRCLISYAKNGRENYENALDRCKIEAQKHFDGDFIFLKNELPFDCKPHSEIPYQFKPKLFIDAFDKGYRQIIWVDSTIVVLEDLEPIFKAMSERGVVAFHNLGHPLKKWCSDIALKNTGIGADENPEQIMACVIGIDLDTKQGLEILNEWERLSDDGESFHNNPGSHPGFMAHRHDQAIMSALLHKTQTKLLPYGNLIYESHYPDGYKGRTAYFLNKAI